MMKFLIAAAIVAGMSTATSSWAGDHAKLYGRTATQISPEAVKRKINELGYDVLRLETEKGQYEAHIVDRQSGGEVKAYFDRESGELLRASLRR